MEGGIPIKMMHQMQGHGLRSRPCVRSAHGAEDEFTPCLHLSTMLGTSRRCPQLALPRRRIHVPLMTEGSAPCSTIPRRSDTRRPSGYCPQRAGRLHHRLLRDALQVDEMSPLIVRPHILGLIGASALTKRAGVSLSAVRSYVRDLRCSGFPCLFCGRRFTT